MQLLFGATGPRPLASATFERLHDLSVASNPDLDIQSDASSDLLIGHAARRFRSWSSPDGTLSVHLDGWVDDPSTDPDAPDRTDGNVLRNLADDYRRDAPRFWSQIDGSFCLIIRDGERLSIGIDATGTRSVYWWQHGPLIAFHSHLMDLAPAYPGALRDDLGAIGDYLADGSYPEGRTALGDIGHLGAGQLLDFDRGRVQVSDHLRMVYRPAPTSKPDAALIDDLVDLVSASVARASRRLVRPIVPISGGVDSRYLLAELVRQQGPDSIETVTWGEGPGRPGSDAEVAPQVTRALGVGHRWRQKSQLPDDESFRRAIYLSSGEADCAIQYSDDHRLHAALASDSFASLIRGDECFGAGPTLITRRAILPVNGIARLGLNPGYRGLVPSELLEGMAAEQEAILHRMVATLDSASATGMRDEVYYRRRLRRVLAIYNRVKHGDLEVITPFLARPLLEWMRGTPDRLRWDKALLRGALARRFPELARIPFATTDNLPRWETWSAQDARLPDFYRQWCATPGWLGSIGAQPAVLAALREMVDRAKRYDTSGPAGGQDDEAAGSRGWRAVAKRTLPGRLLREFSLERRYPANNVPPYLRLARLAVLHGLLGEIHRRARPEARQ